MQQAWRWFGPDDPVTLDHARQAGASAIVTALHQIYDGRVWPLADILARKALVEKAGLVWSVVESIPVHASIKIGSAQAATFIGHYKDTIRNLGQAGIPTVCYNFMPVVDWTRTDLAFALPTTGYALRFDAVDFAAYELFVLKRKTAAQDFPPARIAEAEARFKAMTPSRIETIERNLIAGLPHYQEQDDTLPPAILCDLDGTLAIIHDRSPFDAKRCETDLLNIPVAEIVKTYHEKGVKIILMSGREDSSRSQTMNWLSYNKIPYNALYMRKTGDIRKDSVVKKELYEAHVKRQFFVQFVLDDRNQVVDLWRLDLGLLCLQVNYGDF